MPTRPAVRMFAEPLEPRALLAASFTTLPILPTSNPAVLNNARAIAALGESLGRRTDVFMNVGDSNSSTDSALAPGYLTPLGLPGYNPVASGLAASHPELLGTLSTFQAPVLAGGLNSFDHNSSAAYPGFQVANALATVGGELAATDAGIALIMIGTNDVRAGTDPGVYENELGELVQKLAAAGVVPVLSTIPNLTAETAAYEPQVLVFNQEIADVAAQYNVPLLNTWLGLSTIPLTGVQATGAAPTGVHLTTSPNRGGAFGPADLEFAQNVRNLEALQILNWYQTQVLAPPPPVAAFPTWTALQPGEAVYAVGRGKGQEPGVSVYDAATGQEVDQFLAFPASFTGGVRVAVGDVTGGGVPDIIVAAGPGGGPQVEVFSGTDGALVASFFAFDPGFRDGISSVAAAALDGSGTADVVVGAGPGGGPVVAVFHGGDFSQAERFYAYDSSFRGGVDVAAGTFAGIGPAIVTAPGPGGGPNVRLFSYGATAPVESFYAANPTDASGVAVTAADLTGSGSDQVIVGSLSGRPVVQIYDPLTGSNLANFYAGPATSSGGVRLGAIRGAGGTPDELLVGNGDNDLVSVLGFTGMSGTPTQLSPTDPTSAYGIYVG